MKVTIYSDGSSRGNPGPGGFGTVILYQAPSGRIHRREYAQGYRMTTNNRMELLGAITGLEKLTKPCQVSLYSDSRYLINAFRQHWIDNWIKKGWKISSNKPVKNRDLWQRLLAAQKPHQVEYHWVKGHAGHPENERCDQMAVEAARSDFLEEDTGYMEEFLQNK